jgi:hypothetical protein
MTKAARTKRTRKYRVLYAVTRSEYYEIAAANAKAAEDRAFEEGELIDDSGETTNVVACSAEEVTS